MPIDALPSAPLPTDAPAVFDSKAYSLLGALPTFVSQTNAAEANVNAKEANTVLKEASAVAASAAAVAAANYKGAWSGLSGALNIPASVSHNDTVWMLVSNTANVASITPGVSAQWLRLTGGGILRSARTSNTILGAADKGALIDITSGTFTQTFDAVATLGNGWYCYIRNSGTGDITLDPNASETIDGLTSFVMYPGEVRLVQCDGTALRSVVLTAFYKTFTASGTFTKPPGYTAFQGLLWGAGGSGGNGGQYGSGTGGGGGACVPFVTAAFGATETVTIGSGGAAQATQHTSGNGGGNSSIGSITAYGGGAGYGTNSFVSCSGGGGGGILGAGGVGLAGATPNGGAPFADVAGSRVPNAGFGGGSGAWGAAPGLSAVYGGAGGGGGSTTAFDYNNAHGGASVYGGGGGGSSAHTNFKGTGGASQFGGAGGAGGGSSAGVAGTAPGGGGGACSNTGSSGAGARGELRIWGIV